jgi:hypothetical protein
MTLPPVARQLGLAGRLGGLSCRPDHTGAGPPRQDHRVSVGHDELGVRHRPSGRRLPLRLIRGPVRQRVYNRAYATRYDRSCYWHDPL